MNGCRLPPFRGVFKLSGTYPLPYGFNVSTSFQSFDGTADPVAWVVTRTTRYPGPDVMARLGLPACVGCEAQVGQLVIPQLNQSSITLPLATPGERFLERQNLLSVSTNRDITLRKVSLRLQLDVFNLMNSDTVETAVTTLGTNYGLPRRVFWGRYAELSTRIRW